jgi:hypothetical protein
MKEELHPVLNDPLYPYHSLPPPRLASGSEFGLVWSYGIAYKERIKI